jgi:hypothetical protein
MGTMEIRVFQMLAPGNGKSASPRGFTVCEFPAQVSYMCKIGNRSSTSSAFYRGAVMR